MSETESGSEYTMKSMMRGPCPDCDGWSAAYMEVCEACGADLDRDETELVTREEAKERVREANETNGETPCPACESEHTFSEFVDAEGCPSCDKSLAQLRAISRGGRA